MLHGNLILQSCVTQNKTGRWCVVLYVLSTGHSGYALGTDNYDAEVSHRLEGYDPHMTYPPTRGSGTSMDSPTHSIEEEKIQQLRNVSLFFYLYGGYVVRA